MKHVSTLLMTSALLSLMACGNENEKSKRPSNQSLLLSEAGHYQATLSPLNEHLAGDVEGSARIKIFADQVTMEVKVNGAPASIKHAQYIHVAETCPTLASDDNKDGIIDAKEGMKSYGPAIIPLDSVLKTQTEASSAFPAADFSGNYFYRQDVSMAELMLDLTAKDGNTSDHLIKIRSGLGLAGRQIVIYGVTEETDLPQSVQAFYGKTKQASLPIACGTFIKIAADEEVPSSDGGKE